MQDLIDTHYYLSNFVSIFAGKTNIELVLLSERWALPPSLSPPPTAVQNEARRIAEEHEASVRHGAPPKLSSKASGRNQKKSRRWKEREELSERYEAQRNRTPPRFDVGLRSKSSVVDELSDGGGIYIYIIYHIYIYTIHS